MILEDSRENILKNIRQALAKGVHSLEQPELASPVLKAFKEEDTAIIFAENFVKTKGVFFFCETKEDFYNYLKTYLEHNSITKLFAWEKDVRELLLESKVSFSETDTDFINAEAGITKCEALIARTGSILISSATEAGRRLSIYPPTHLVIAFTSQIEKEVAEGLLKVKNKYKQIPSMVSVITGPSRTADIEKTLVLGAHGPKELVLFLIDDSSH